MIADEACYERGCACHDSRESAGIEVTAKKPWVGLTDAEINGIVGLWGNAVFVFRILNITGEELIRARWKVRVV